MSRDVNLVPNPVRGEWGDYSQIEQYLHGIKWCFENFSFDWLMTLSGLTYPLKNLSEFERLLEESNFDAYVRYFDAYDPSQWPTGTAINRFHFSYFKLPRFRYYYRLPRVLKKVFSRLRNWVNKNQPLIRILSMPRGARTRVGFRRFNIRPTSLEQFELTGGRNILNLNTVAIRKILDFDRAHPEFKQFLRRTVCPDEIYFTSIVANEKSLNVFNDSLRYIKWPRAHAASGSVISGKDLLEAIESNAPFGLKFDWSVDIAPLHEMDRILGITPDKD